jgi:hypothetical protein
MISSAMFRQLPRKEIRQLDEPGASAERRNEGNHLSLFRGRPFLMF